MNLNERIQAKNLANSNRKGNYHSQTHLKTQPLNCFFYYMSLSKMGTKMGQHELDNLIN